MGSVLNQAEDQPNSGHVSLGGAGTEHPLYQTLEITVDTATLLEIRKLLSAELNNRNDDLQGYACDTTLNPGDLEYMQGTIRGILDAIRIVNTLLE